MNAAAEGPVFWKSMIYACSECEREHVFLLEDGLGGPRDREAPPPPELAESYEGEPGDLPDEVWFTESGRVVLAVPFVAMGCPDCQGPPPWDPMDGALRHVRWDEDEVLDPPVVGVPDGPHFRYPEDPSRPRAHGEPVIPGSFDYREERDRQNRERES